MRLVFLDSQPLGMIANPGRSPAVLRCHDWARDLLAAGVRVFMPEICDFEVRRKLLHIGATASLRRLDQAKTRFEYAPLTTDVMLRAAELWAQARRAGRPTSDPQALDGDCILAAQALMAAGPGDLVTVATANVGHLAQFVDAQPWETITG